MGQKGDNQTKGNRNELDWLVNGEGLREPQQTESNRRLGLGPVGEPLVSDHQNCKSSKICKHSNLCGLLQQP